MSDSKHPIYPQNDFHRHAILLVGLVLIVGLACSLPFSFNLKPTDRVVPQVAIATRDFNLEATLYQKLTETYLVPSETPSPTATVTPDPGPPFFIEGGVEKIPQMAGSVNLLILGSDFRPGAGFRTDVILLAHISPDASVSFVSFPRDLYLTIPGYPDERINSAMQTGGFELVQKVFEYNFGIHPDDYILTDFEGFRNLVDLLGGIDINAAETLTDWCDLPSGRKGYCTISEGENHLDGEMALWYSRSRYSTSDFDRGRRAEELAIGFFKRLISLEALVKSPSIYMQLKDHAETNLTLDGMTPYLPLAASLARSNNFTYSPIGPDQVNVFIPASGAYLLLQDQGKVRELLVKAFGN